MNSGERREDVISVQVQVTRNDYVRAYRRQFWRSLGWLVAFAPAIALLPIARAPAFRAELASGAPAAVAVAVAIYAGVTVFLAFMVELLARSFSSYGLRKAPAALASRIVTFTKDGMHAPGSDVRWHEFSKAVETSSGFQLQLRAGPYMLLPRHQISSVPQIRQLLRTYLGHCAKIRK